MTISYDKEENRQKISTITLTLTLDVVDYTASDVELRDLLGKLQFSIPLYVAENFDHHLKLVDYQQDEEADGAHSVMLFFEAQ